MTITTEELAQASLEALKDRATLLGISFHPSIGEDKLREKVTAYLAESVGEAATTESVGPTPAQLIADASKLVRINITSMNPLKKEWQGEVFTVGNAVVGTYKKYVPFNTTDGWHVPHIIYEEILGKKYQHFYYVKDERGNSIRRSKLVNAYAVQVLPQLSQEELDELGRIQAASHAID